MAVKNIKKLILILIFACLASLFSVTIVFAYETASVISPDISETLPDAGGGDGDDFSGGYGTESNPYRISSEEDLIELQDNVNNNIQYGGKFFKVTKDIELSDYSDFTGIGENPKGILNNIGNDYKKPFSGTFDGDGHTISNIYLTVIGYRKVLENGIYSDGTSLSSGGFFAWLNGAAIKNLHLDGVYITLTNVHPLGGTIDVALGAIAGFSDYETTISNCKVSNYYLYCRDGSGYTFVSMGIGGILGSGYKYGNDIGYETITDCEVCDMKIFFDEENYKKGQDLPKYIGAIAGWIPCGIIKNCVACIYDTYTEDGEKYKCFVCDMTAPPDNDNTNQVAGKAATVTNVITSKETKGGLDWSDSTEYTEDTTWFYANSSYRLYPTLRAFISWKWVNFSVNPEGVGKVDKSSIRIPNECTNPSISKSSNSITILCQRVTATSASSDYTFQSWSGDISSGYVANFKLQTYSLTFKTVTGTATGENIYPTETTSSATTFALAIKIFTIKKSCILDINNDGSKLIYTFTDSDDVSHTIEYDIVKYGSKYTVVDTKYTKTSSIAGFTDNVEIIPEVTIKTFEVKFKAAEGSDITTDKIIYVTYGDSITYSYQNNNEITSFTYGTDIITYTADSANGYEFVSVKVIKGGTESTEVATALTNITEKLEIKLTFARWCTVTFNTVSNATLTGDKSFKVAAGDSISVSGNNSKNLEYTYQGKTASYSANKYYILQNNATLKITENTEITPTVLDNFCIVTMGDISSTYGTRSVSGDSYGTANDGVFKIEKGDWVNFNITLSSNVFKYTYTFKAGQVVKYTMASASYAMQYTISSGSRTKILNGINGNYSATISTSTKSISPTFGNRQILVTLKSAANTKKTSNTYWEAYYGQSITYSNPDNTDITFEYNGNSVTYQPNTGYKCFGVSFVGKTWDDNEVTLTETALSKLVYDITISLEYTRIYQVTFNEAEHATLTASINPIEMKEGDSLTVDKTSLNKLIYKYNGSTVATYTGNKFYVWDTYDEINNITATKTIQPTFVFSACKVTMGDISSTYGTRTIDGETYETENDFVVEYDSMVEFTIEQIAGTSMFKYIYTFSSNGVVTHKVTYTITNDDYAIQYVLNSAGERTKVLNGLNGSDSYEFKKANGSSKTITPEFGKRQYMVEME